MTVAELFARIGLKTDEGKAKSFHKTMGAVKMGLVAVTAVAAGTSLAIRKITSDAMAAAVAFTQFEAETGASAQKLQLWQSVAEQTNQTAGSVTAAVKAIADNQAKIRLGQGNISGYQLLGIDPRQDPFKILEELRVKTKGLTEAQKKNILSMTGVGVGMLQTLSLSRQEFDAMASKAFIISPSAISTLNKTKASLDLAGRGVKWLKSQIAVGLSPQIKATTKALTEFIKANERGIIEGFKKAYTIVEKFAGMIGNVATIINNAVAGTIGWSSAIKFLAAAFVIFNLVLGASPIGIITAGIILLVAVLDDIAVYSRGGKSLFGTLMDKFPEMEKILFGFLDKLKEIKELFIAFGEGDKMKINDILDQWGLLGDIIQGVYEGITKVDEFLDTSAWDTDTNKAGNVSGFINRQIEGDQGFKDFLANPLSWIKDAGLILSGRGDETVNNNLNVEVYGAEDPELVAERVKETWAHMIPPASAQRGTDE